MADDPGEGGRGRSPGDVLRLALPLAALVAFWIGFALWRLHGFRLGIGTILDPTPDSLRLALTMSALGIPATYLTTRLLLLVFTPERVTALRRTLVDIDRKQALWLLGLVGVLLPALVRHTVLGGAPLTDDEASYWLAAETLASGRLSVPSPPMPVFFDNAFIVNDGKLYSQYFLGWPALLMLGVWTALPGLVNPLLAGLTTVLLTLIGERRWGFSWGVVAGLLHACSPFLMVSAATQMSHTSCMFALTVVFWSVDGFVQGEAPKRLSALVAAGMCLAFWIRPATGLGFGLPLLLFWLAALRRQQRPLAHVALFLAVSVGPALLFFWVNQQLTGSPWSTGYHAGAAHAAATHYRLTSFNESSVVKDQFFYFFVRPELARVLGKYAFALMRMWTDAWGFPIGLALLLGASRKGARMLWAPVIGLAIAHVPLPDPGIDTFGPVHFTEMMISIVLLSVDGLRTLHRAGSRLSLPGLAPALLAASFVCSFVFYCVPRFVTMALLAADVRAPVEAFETAPDNSIVFVGRLYAPPCLGLPGNHFVLFRPNNDPDLKNPRLWANHVDLETDRKLLAATGRKGFLLRHDLRACRIDLVPIEAASAREFPPVLKLIPGDLGEVRRTP